MTRNNYKRLLGVLFSYAVSRTYLSTNPARLAEKAKVKPEKPGILTAEQSERLLRNAPSEILPAIAIGLFAGLRPEAEVWRLDWSAIDLDEKLIDVSKSKNVASDRFVTISDNLAAWLRGTSEDDRPGLPDRRQVQLSAATSARRGLRLCGEARKAGRGHSDMAAGLPAAHLRQHALRSREERR